MLRIKSNTPRNFYLDNKILFIEEQKDIKDITKQIYFDGLIHHVLPYEMNKGKDLYEFTTEEIREIIRNLPVLKERNIRTLFSAINKYETWATSRGLCPLGNPCESIDIKELMNLDKDTKESIYIKLNDFWDTINRYHNEFNIGYQHLIILVMYRYGVQSNWINTVRFEDINYEDKIIRIYKTKERKEILTELPIDDRFLNAIEECKKDKGEYYALKKSMVYRDYVNNGYIIMSTNKVINDVIASESSTKIVPITTIYTRYNNIFKITQDVRYRIKDLTNSRRIDMLININERNRRVTTYDIEDVIKLYSGKKASYTSIFNLKDDFINVTGIEVVNKIKAKSKK